MNMICPNCDKEHANPKFCSRSCSVSYNNRKHPKRIAIGKEAMCLKCGSDLQGKSGKRFCSRDCSNSYRQSQWISEWISGNRVGGSDSSVYAWVKEYLKEQQGFACAICHLSKWMGKDIGLICDHIDGDSSDHSPGNLRMICGNCDMQLPTYKGRNNGKGRHYRKMRYAEGLSYWIRRSQFDPEYGL